MNDPRLNDLTRRMRFPKVRGVQQEVVHRPHLWFGGAKPDAFDSYAGYATGGSAAITVSSEAKVKPSALSMGTRASVSS